MGSGCQKSIWSLILVRERLAELRTLRLRLADLVREASVLSAGVAGAEALKREVHVLGRQVLQERAKVQALGQELENPLNVHRQDAADLLEKYWNAAQ